MARPGYDCLDASEYLDAPATLSAKVRALAQLLRQTRHCVVYTGAGLSTAAGINDYASKASNSLIGIAPLPRSGMSAEIPSRSDTTAASGVKQAGEAQPVRSPLCSQPTRAHRVLVAMHASGYFQRWVNQNHDGLPQKAGLPQEAINEIHGAWHAPDNPVVGMSGSARGDLTADLRRCERDVDLTVAVGTSLCGMKADCIVTSPAQRAARGEQGQLGSVIIGLQRTVHDDQSTLRIFGTCDDVFDALAKELALDVMQAPCAGQFFCPAVLTGRAHADYVFKGIPYDDFGERSDDNTSDLDLREGAELVIPSGEHAGAVGVVEGFDQEGNIRCRFTLKPKVGMLRMPITLPLGRWWTQAAVDGSVPQLPVVNTPADEQTSHAANCLRIVIKKYSS